MERSSVSPAKWNCHKFNHAIIQAEAGQIQSHDWIILDPTMIGPIGFAWRYDWRNMANEETRLRPSSFNRKRMDGVIHGVSELQGFGIPM
jgi:hypothetical protein